MSSTDDDVKRADLFAELESGTPFHLRHAYWGLTLNEKRNYTKEQICLWFDQVEPRIGSPRWQRTTWQTFSDKAKAAGLEAKHVALYLLDRGMAVPSMNMSVLTRKTNYQPRETALSGKNERDLILMDTRIPLGSPRYMNGSSVRTELPILVETLSAINEVPTKGRVMRLAAEACEAIRDIDHCLSDRLRTAVALEAAWPAVTTILGWKDHFPHEVWTWLTTWDRIDHEMVQRAKGEVAGKVPTEASLEARHFEEWAQTLP